VLVLAPLAAAGGGTTPQTVTIAATSAEPYVIAGSSLGIKGGVKPHVGGVALSLQQHRDGGWFIVGAATSGANGAFSFTVQPKTPGLATFRVVAAKGTSYTGDSAPFPVQVVHWTYLANVYVQMPRGTGELDTEAVKADGVTYQYPVALDAGCYNAWNGTSWIEYDLGKQDEALKATVAIADDALPGTTGSYAVVVDRKTVASGNLVPGQSAKINVPLAGASRLKLMANFPDPTGAGGCGTFYPRMVFGDAQLLGT
jgi:hypothetical protein